MLAVIAPLDSGAAPGWLTEVVDRSERPVASKPRSDAAPQLLIERRVLNADPRPDSRVIPRVSRRVDIDASNYLGRQRFEDSVGESFPGRKIICMPDQV